jgi:hypothetical protein
MGSDERLAVDHGPEGKGSLLLVDVENVHPPRIGWNGSVEEPQVHRSRAERARVGSLLHPADHRSAAAIAGPRLLPAVRGQVNPRLGVPRRGLEPPCLAALDPESSVSTNSTTWAVRSRGLYEAPLSVSRAPGLNREKGAIKETGKVLLEADRVDLRIVAVTCSFHQPKS